MGNDGNDDGDREGADGVNINGQDGGGCDLVYNNE